MKTAQRRAFANPNSVGIFKNLWRYYFPLETLERVDSARRVRIPVRVSTANSIVSPLTGLRAAAFVWRFMTHKSEHVEPIGHAGLLHDNRSPERYTVVARETWGEGLILDSKWGAIEVPKGPVDLRVAGLKDHGPFLDRPLPQELDSVRQLLERAELPAHYLEIPITHGTALQLTASVERSPRSGDAYRDAGESSCPFRVRADLADVRLDDFSTLD